MNRISLFIVINAISLFIVDKLMPSVYIGSLSSLIVLTVIFGCLNTIVKPIIQFFSIPMTLLSFGLFSFVINGIVLKLAFGLVPGAHISGFIYSILAAILLSVVNTVLYNALD